jgi:hypothetical protein
MGKYDKDRHQKEMAIRYCLAQGMSPCLEVVVASASDLSDTTEVLTDLDVVGLDFIADGGFRRLIFDCKTTNKMSAVNRAFWAAGILAYSGCDEAFVILKNKAVYNHRLSALTIGVDLHDEASFEDLGNSRDIGFNADINYQSSIDRWNAVFEIYGNNTWSEALFLTGRNAAPLSVQPWRVFRKMVAEVRTARGQFDPAKDGHVAIFFDVMAAIFILWSSIGRDIRRFYDPKMSKAEFEKALLYYIWGGKESYQIRQELRQKTDTSGVIQEFPSWEKLVAFAGLVIAGPHELFGCVNICREMSIRMLFGKLSEQEKGLSLMLSANKRARQFIMAASEYMIAASGLPKDLAERIQSEFSGL